MRKGYEILQSGMGNMKKIIVLNKPKGRGELVFYVKAWMILWRSQLALQLVYMVYTKLLQTNRGLGSLLETPNTPLKNVQIQGIVIEKNI